jgi:hypothetical protein
VPPAVGNIEVLDRPVISPEALAYLTRRFRAALETSRPARQGSKPSFHKETRKYFRRDPRAFRCMLGILESPAVAAAVRARAVRPYLDHMDLLIKEPHAPETGWHQDRPYWAWDQPASMFTIWVTLEDLRRENGCLRIAGSNIREIFPHRMLAYGSDQAFSALLIDPEQFDVGTLPVREISLDAGCALVFDSFTVHGAFPNGSDRPRLSFKLVLGDRERRTTRGGTRILDVGTPGYRLNRRLGFLPAFAALNAREAVVPRARRVLRKLRGARD